MLNDYEEQEEGKPQKIPKTLVEKDSQRRLIVILENANLETVKACFFFLAINLQMHVAFNE